MKKVVLNYIKYEAQNKYLNQFLLQTPPGMHTVNLGLLQWANASTIHKLNEFAVFRSLVEPFYIYIYIININIYIILFIIEYILCI